LAMEPKMKASTRPPTIVVIRVVSWGMHSSGGGQEPV
jgi:hypothetical protein